MTAETCVHLSRRKTIRAWRRSNGRVRRFGTSKSKSRFFAHHPRTYPTELSLCGAPGTFGAPFTQNDIAEWEEALQLETERRISGFFAHHPRTCPTELSLCGAPGTFGVPFTQNDIAEWEEALQLETERR
jgi:hypothetical protein